MIDTGDELIAEPAFVHPRQGFPCVSGEKSGRTGVGRLFKGIFAIADAVSVMSYGKVILPFGKRGIGDFAVIHGQYTLEGVTLVAFIHHFVNHADEPSVSVERFFEGQIFHFGETFQHCQQFHQLCRGLFLQPLISVRGVAQNFREKTFAGADVNVFRNDPDGFPEIPLKFAEIGKTEPRKPLKPFVGTVFDDEITDIFDLFRIFQNFRLFFRSHGRNPIGLVVRIKIIVQNLLVVRKIFVQFLYGFPKFSMMFFERGGSIAVFGEFLYAFAPEFFEFLEPFPQNRLVHAEQIVCGYAEIRCNRHDQRHVGQAFAALPFADRLCGDVQTVGEHFLRDILFPPEPADIFTDGIHKILRWLEMEQYCF